MVRGSTQQVKEILLANGGSMVPRGKGDHEVRVTPTARRPFPVDGRITSRAVANEVLKQAGLKERL